MTLTHPSIHPTTPYRTVLEENPVLPAQEVMKDLLQTGGVQLVKNVLREIRDLRESNDPLVIVDRVLKKHLWQWWVFMIRLIRNMHNICNMIMVIILFDEIYLQSHYSFLSSTSVPSHHHHHHHHHHFDTISIIIIPSLSYHHHYPMMINVSYRFYLIHGCYNLDSKTSLQKSYIFLRFRFSS